MLLMPRDVLTRLLSGGVGRSGSPEQANEQI